ncbi:MAG: MlaD family protein, partial [Leptospirillia bacterium]
MQTEAKVGFAVILAAIMLVTMLGKVERWTSSTESGTRILTRFNTVAGLEVKSAVQVAGVTVGQVESINLENGMADVEVLLFPGVNIYRGAKATIRSTGLLGDKYMEILSGD